MTMETLIREDIVEGGGVAADERRIIQWSSVIAGALAAGAMSFILVGFGVAVGLGVSSASPTWRDASAALALLSGLYLIIQAIISFGFGGYIAGYDGSGNPIYTANNGQTPGTPLPTNHPNDPLKVPGYGLLDLRAGLSKDSWRFQVWGRNVTNQWYWTGAAHVNDVLLRYTGMPTTIGFTLTYRYH